MILSLLGKLVVYGSSLAAYSVIAAVLGAGLSSSRLVLVRPRAHSCFSIPSLEERVGRALQEEGVATHVGFVLQGLSSGDEGVRPGTRFVGVDGEPELNVECKVIFSDGTCHVLLRKLDMGLMPPIH